LHRQSSLRRASIAAFRQRCTQVSPPQSTMCECAGGAGIPFDCILWATDTHLAFRIFFALDEVEAHPLIHDGDLLLAATRNAVSTPSREARLPPGRSGARTLKLNARTCSCVWVSDSASASCSSATSRARSAFCTATAFEPETTLSVRLRAHGEDARACAAEQSRADGGRFAPAAPWPHTWSHMASRRRSAGPTAPWQPPARRGTRPSTALSLSSTAVHSWRSEASGWHHHLGVHLEFDGHRARNDRAAAGQLCNQTAYEFAALRIFTLTSHGHGRGADGGGGGDAQLSRRRCARLPPEPHTLPVYQSARRPSRPPRACSSVAARAAALRPQPVGAPPVAAPPCVQCACGPSTRARRPAMPTAPGRSKRITSPPLAETGMSASTLVSPRPRRSLSTLITARLEPRTALATCSHSACRDLARQPVQHQVNDTGGVRHDGQGRGDVRNGGHPR
jgi:hypothetical protein